MCAFGFLTLILATFSGSAQIWSESFETDGEGVAYTSSNTFNDGVNDHFARTDGANIGIIGGAYTGADGTFFWAGEDLDDNGRRPFISKDFNLRTD